MLVNYVITVLPVCVFIGLVVHYRRRHNRLPSKSDGGALLYYSFEGTAALIVLSLVVVGPPELIVSGVERLEEFLTIIALRTAWGAYHSVAAIF